MLQKNRKKKKCSYAVSEIVGTVVLLAIAVALFSVIYLTLSSSLVIQESPKVNIVGYVEGNDLILEHLGGSSLDSSIEFLVTIGGQQQTLSLDTIVFSDTNNNGRWDIGERVYYSSSRIGGVYSVVASVRDTTSNKLLYSGLLKDGINEEEDDIEAPLIVYVSNDFNELTDGWGYDHFNDLQQGIDHVAETGLVYLLNGIYEGGYLISKPLSVIGESLHQTIIDANEEVSDGYLIIDSTEDVLLSTFTVRNGYIIPDDDDEDEGIYAAVMSRNSSNITVTDLVIYDVNAGYASLEDISEIEASNLIVYNCSIGVGIRNGTHAVFSDNHVYDCNIGVFIVDSDSQNVLFEDNTIDNTLAGIYFINCNNVIVRNNIIQNAEVFGILFDFETGSHHNVIYNNKFVNNSVHVKDEYQNQYNITKTPGSNIIGGSFIAGNYYDDYTGYDMDDDGVGDTNLPYTSNGNIINGGDYQPLTLQTTLSPVSHWKMDENNGCIAMDTYGGNDGTLQPNCPGTGPQWTQGISNSALLFNGNDDYIHVDDAPNLNPTTNMTIAAWVKWSIDPNTGGPWTSIVNKNGDRQYRLQHNYDNSLFEFGIQTSRGGRHLRSITSPIQDIWYHVVGTYDGETVKIYVNGSFENSISWTGSITASSEPLFIGKYSTVGRNFNGVIDEVSFYNRSLSADEIQTLYLQTNTQGEQNNILVAHWEFNEAEGAIAYDSAGDNDGTIIGPTWTTGVNGSALYFDGVNDYVEVADNLTLNPIELTLMAWVKHGPTTDHRAIIDKRDAINDGYNLYISPTGTAWMRINDDTLTGTSDIDDDVWHHIVGTYDGSTLRIYVDGVEENSNSIGSETIDTVNPLRIGLARDNSFDFQGIIDDARIYNYALSIQEIAAIYDSTKPSEDDGPLALWEFNENTGTIAYDSIGDNHGTIDSATWAQGISGSALSFDAAQDSSVNVAYDDSLALAYNFSISFWIYPTPSTVQWRTFLTRQSQFTCSYIGGNKIRVHINGYANIDSQSAAPRNSWTHVVFTVEDTSIGDDIIRLYINGELDGQIGPTWGTHGTPANPLLIGGDGSSSYFTGRLDEIGIYDRALTAEEVMLLYNQ